MLKKWCVSILASILLFSMGVSPVFGDLLDEISLENSMSNKAQQLLDNLYGPRNFVVKVDVLLTEPKYEVKYTQQSDPKLNNKKQEGDKVNILPGYPVIKNLSDGLNQLPFDSVTTFINPKVRKIEVELIVNKEFPKKNIGRAKQSVSEILSLDDRRDTIKESFKEFYSPGSGTQDVSITDTPAGLLEFPNLFYLVICVLIAIFLILYSVLKVKELKARFDLNGAAAKAETGGGGNGGGEGGGKTSIELPDMGGGSDNLSVSAEPLIKRYFDFVSKDTVDKLSYIIKREKLSLENVAIIAAFLPPELSSKLILDLDDKSQAMAGLSLLNQRMVNRATADKLEAGIKSAMECLIGGQQTFSRAFSYVPSSVKKKLLDILKAANPEGYAKFRENVLLFDDIKLLTDDEIKVVVSELNMDVLSKALVSADKQVYEKIYQNMTGTAKQMVTQYLDLKGKTTSKEAVEDAQESVMRQLEKLDGESKIDLKSKLSSKGAAKPPVNKA